MIFLAHFGISRPSDLRCQYHFKKIYYSDQSLKKNVEFSIVSMIKIIKTAVLEKKVFEKRYESDLKTLQPTSDYLKSETIKGIVVFQIEHTSEIRKFSLEIRTGDLRPVAMGETVWIPGFYKIGSRLRQFELTEFKNKKRNTRHLDQLLHFEFETSNWDLAGSFQAFGYAKNLFWIPRYINFKSFS